MGINTYIRAERLGVFDQPDENTERQQACDDYNYDPYTRAECNNGNCRCLKQPANS